MFQVVAIHTDTTCITIIYFITTYCLAIVYSIKAEEGWFASQKRLHLHRDIVLRTPTSSTAERLLIVGTRNPKDMFNNLMGIIKPDFGKAERNIFAIKTVTGLNDVFGLQFSGSKRNEENAGKLCFNWISILGKNKSQKTVGQVY